MIDKNKLLLNWEKTKYMIFSTRKISENINIYVEDVRIIRVAEIKFLGVMLDTKLTWKPHLEYIQTKVSKCIGILNRVKYLLKEASLLMLYTSLIMPYLTYCCEVWGTAYSSVTERLYLLQKKAIRIISHKGKREHTNPLFIKLKIMKLKDLIDFKIIPTMWRIKNKLLPEHICNKLTLITDPKSRRKGNFCVVYARTGMRRRGVLFSGVSLWNSLDKTLKFSKTINQLKNMFKKTTFVKYMDSC